MNVNKFLPVFLTGLFLFSAFAVIFDSDESDASLPSADLTVNVLTKSYYTNSPSESFWFSDTDEGNTNCGYIIASAYAQNKLEINRSGAPSWISFELSSIKFDIRFTISPGAVCDDVFWILFTCFGQKLLITFELTVIDSGSGVIPEDGYNTFILKIDTKGGSSISSISVQSASDNHTFDLFKIKIPARSGYKFIGWSDSSSADSLLISTTKNLVLPFGERTVSGTIYAVWEKDTFVVPTVWNDIVDFFSQPIVLLLILGSSLFFAVLIRIRLVG